MSIDDTLLYKLGEGKVSRSTSEDEDEEKNDNQNCPHYDTKHEANLKQQLIDIAFCNDFKGWTDVSTKDEEHNPITSHYRFLTTTAYKMRAEMNFENQHYDIMNYYTYLRSGYNDDDMTWTNKASLNKIIKVFDDDHQLMYNKGNGGFLNYFISPRDTCYIRTRFKKKSHIFKQTSYDIVSSLHYSAPTDHHYYYPLDKKCVRVDLKYRGFMLIYNKELKQTKLIYTAHWDIKGNIPQWITEAGVKNIASNYISQFHKSWWNKIKCLKQREQEHQKQQMKLWMMNVVGLPQYLDHFMKHGFEDLSYFKNTELNEDVLKDIGIFLKGHRLKILSEIKKL